MKQDYDPKSAVLGYREGLRQLLRKAERDEAPHGLIDKDGTAYHAAESSGPATVCVLLLAFLKRHPMVPGDFHNVERTKQGIENYVRPDGGVYLGTYELPKDPGSAVMVWGDPAMGPVKAAAASLAYRKKLTDAFLHSTEGSR